MMLRIIAAAALAALLLPLQAAAADTGETARVWQVDTSGRPPFKRTLVEVPVADAASVETVETARVWSADYSGRPPFRRGFRELPEVDVASLETRPAGLTIKPVQSKPFFKPRHR